MALTVEELVIQLSAKTDNVTAQLNTVTTQLDTFGKKAAESSKTASKGFEDFGSVIKGIVAGAAFQKFIQHTLEVEQAGYRLQAVLRATGRDAGDTANQISRLAGELEHSTLFDGEDIKNAAAQLLTFKNVANDSFERVIRLGTDLAAVMGTDVKGAIFQLGRALESPVEGMNRLSRSGIVFTESQKQMIVAMNDAGDAAGAQAAMLDILQGKVGGVAQEMHSGLSGALHEAGKSVDFLMETMADTGVIDLFVAILDELSNAAILAGAAINLVASGVNTLLGRTDAANESAKRTVELWNKLNDTEEESTKIKLKEAAATGELTANQIKLNEASEKLADTLEQKMLDNALELQKMGLDPLGQKLAEIDDLVGRNAAAFKNMGAEGKNLVATIKMQTTELHHLQEAQEKAKKEAEEMQKAFDHAFENIQDALANMILDGDFSFKSLVAIAKKAAAEIAAAMVIKPVIGGIASNLVGGLGFTETAANMPGAGGLGTILSGGKSLFSGISSLYDSGSVAGGFNSLNMFGYNNLGTGLPGLSGSLTGGASLTGLLGTAGMGAGIGGLATMLTGGNSTGGSIGGALGGLAGNFLLPGVGGLIGSALGGVVGGMFGGGTPHPASEFSTNFNALGGTVGSNVASKHSDKTAGQAALDQVSALAAQLGGMGVDLSGVSVRGGNAMVRGGNYFEVAGQQQISFGNDAAAADEALKQLIVQLGDVADISNQDVAEAFKNLQTEGKTAADVMNELALAANRPALKKALEDQLQLDILKITDPAKAQAQEINAQFDELLTRATELGADVTLVEKLRQLTLDKIDGTAKAIEDATREAARMADKFAAVADQLSNTLNELFFGEDTIFSQQQQYDAAKAQFQTVATAAQGGDIGAMEQLSDAFKTFIGESRALNASGTNYANDFNYGTSVLQGAMQLAASQAMAYGTQSATPGAGQVDLSGISAAINALAKSQTQTNAIIKTMATNSERRAS